MEFMEKIPGIEQVNSDGIYYFYPCFMFYLYGYSLVIHITSNRN